MLSPPRADSSARRPDSAICGFAAGVHLVTEPLPRAAAYRTVAALAMVALALANPRVGVGGAGALLATSWSDGGVVVEDVAVAVTPTRGVLASRSFGW